MGLPSLYRAPETCRKQEKILASRYAEFLDIPVVILILIQANFLEDVSSRSLGLDIF
jgi:hypothetical protein